MYSCGTYGNKVDSPAEYVQAIRDMINAAGVDHVCIGTDTKLTPGNRGPGGQGVRQGGGPNGGPGGGPGNRSAGRPGNSTGERPGGGRGRDGDRTNQAWSDEKVGFYYAVVSEMIKQKFTPDEIGKVSGGNFCRVFAAATAGHS